MILSTLAHWCDAHDRTRIIKDHQEPSADYLVRRYLLGGVRGKDGEIRHRWFGLCLHTILRSDADWLHDHPGPWASLILKGAYIEHTPKGAFVRRPGSFRFRSARARHRLELPWGAVTTLFFFGPRTREWGFYSPGGKWILWEHHLADMQADKHDHNPYSGTCNKCGAYSDQCGSYQTNLCPAGVADAP